MVGEYSTKYFSEIKEVLDRIDLKAVEKVVGLLTKAYHGEDQIFVMGNGGSASAASHFACDINKGACQPFLKKFKVISLSDNIAMITAYANDLSYEDVFVEQMKNYLKARDVVIGISASGNSANVLKAVEYAKSQGATTVGLTGFDGGELGKKAEINLHVSVKDMQKAEDIHLMLIHLVMQLVQRELERKAVRAG